MHLASPEICHGTHVADVINEILREQLEDVVLVGHSYGGMVISAAADSLGESAGVLPGPAFQ